jgi:hypothetical protein
MLSVLFVDYKVMPTASHYGVDTIFMLYSTAQIIYTTRGQNSTFKKNGKLKLVDLPECRYVAFVVCVSDCSHYGLGLDTL